MKNGHSRVRSDETGHAISRTLCRKVWAHISEHPSASYREIRDGIGQCISTSQVGAAIQYLQRQGYIVKPPYTGRAIRILVPFSTGATVTSNGRLVNVPGYMASFAV